MQKDTDVNCLNRIFYGNCLKMVFLKGMVLLFLPKLNKFQLTDYVSQNPVSDEEIIKRLPDKETVLFGMKLTKILSTRASNPLGEWDIRFQYDKDAVAAENR